MSSSMRNFMEAYTAVHSSGAREELTSKRDYVSEMDLSHLTDSDLCEIAEQVLETVFASGTSAKEGQKIIHSLFSESTIVGRQQKVDRILEAFKKAFAEVNSKASDVALESFAKYRHNKKLQETWSARFNQEKRVQRVHSKLVAESVSSVKALLLKMVEEKKAKKDYDGDGEVESGTDEYMGSRDKAIKKAMGKKGKTCKECGGKGCSHCGGDGEMEEGIDFKGAAREQARRDAIQAEKDKKSPSSKDRRLARGKFRPGASAAERAEGGRDAMREKGTSPTKDGKKMFEELKASGLFSEKEIEAIIENL